MGRLILCICVKPRKNGKMVNCCANLVTKSNFIEFQDGRNFIFFEASGVGLHMGWCHMA